VLSIFSFLTSLGDCNFEESCLKAFDYTKLISDSLRNYKIPALGLAITISLADLRFGWNLHSWDIPTEQFRSNKPIQIAGFVLFGAATSLTKMSMLYFYIRISKDVNFAKFTRTAVLWTIAIAVVIQGLFYQSMTAMYYSQAVTRYAGKVLLAVSIFSVVLDLIIVGIPIPLVWKLRLSVRERLIMVSFFAVGFLVCLAGLARLLFGWLVMQTSTDPIWDSLTIWSIAAFEVYVAMVSHFARNEDVS
jgi:hypothetical protein